MKLMDRLALGYGSDIIPSIPYGPLANAVQI